MRFFTPLSCDIEPYITNPTPRKIVVWSVSRSQFLRGNRSRIPWTIYSQQFLTRFLKSWQRCYAVLRTPQLWYWTWHNQAHLLEDFCLIWSVSWSVSQSQLWRGNRSRLPWTISYQLFLPLFWKVDEWRKMISQLWLRMTRYINYISSRYVFISSFVFLTNYAGQEPKNLMWLRMEVEFMSFFWGTVWAVNCG